MKHADTRTASNYCSSVFSFSLLLAMAARTAGVLRIALESMLVDVSSAEQVKELFFQDFYAKLVGISTYDSFLVFNGMMTIQVVMILF